MASLVNQYDADAKPYQGKTLFPNGIYTVTVTQGDWQTSKAGHKYLELVYTVAEGPMRGEEYVDRFNLNNPNDTAKKIANEQFASLRKAVGVPNPKDTSELMRIRFRIKVECREQKNDPEHRLENNVRKYMNMKESVDEPAQNAGQPPQARVTADPAHSPVADATVPADDCPF